MNSLMVRCWRGGNRAAPLPRSASSQRHRIEAPSLGFEFLGALLDSGAFVWGFDGAEQDGLGGDLVNIPACRLRRLLRELHSRRVCPPWRSVYTSVAR